jgi:hypothetical protein
MSALRRSLRAVLPRARDRELARFLVALALPPVLGPVRLFLAAPLIVRLTGRAR